MALLLAEERFLKIKQAVEEEQNQPEVMQELLLKLMNDLQILNGIQPKQEEQAAQSFLLNWNFPMVDDDEYTIIYRSTKTITLDLPTVEPDNSLSMGDEPLSTIPETESDEVIKSSVENLVPIPSESKGISDDICDVPFCDNDHFDAEFGLINSLLSRDISITSPKIDFLPEEFAGELDLIDPILPGIDEDDFDEEEREIDIDIFQIEDEILREKLLNVNLLIDKIEALYLTPSIPFIPPSIESDFDSEGDIIFLNDLLNDDLILEYERFTFDIEHDAPVINNFDELNEDEFFKPEGGGRLSAPERIALSTRVVIEKLVPEYDLYDLKLTREEDGAVETLDPYFCMGSEWLEILDATFLDLLLDPTFVMSLSFPKLFLLGFVCFTILDALGASVSDEDANHKFLRSLPPAHSKDIIFFSPSINVAFLSQAKASSSKHKPSHNSGSYSSYTTSSSKATPTATPGLADEVIHSFLATNADDVDLIHDDLDQIDDLDLEEMDINWQIAMTAIKIKKFYKKTGRRPRVDGKMHVAFDKRKVECFNCHNTGHFARECKFKDGSRKEASRGQDFKPVRTEKEALMTIDEGQINWVEQTQIEEISKL
ncbi:putative reverse transcriptase domain-containing protein [Tanacetum coccineum]